MDGRVEGQLVLVVVMMVQASAGGGKGERTKGQGSTSGYLIVDKRWSGTWEVQFHKLLR